MSHKVQNLSPSSAGFLPYPLHTRAVAGLSCILKPLRQPPENIKLHYCKGQVNYPDFFVAMMIFMVIATFIMAFTMMAVDNANSSVKKTRMEVAAIDASEMLIKSPGVPKDWEKDATQVKSLGLVVNSSANVLSDAKLANFTSISGQNYTAAKSLLGIEHEFYFYIENMSGTRLYEAGNGTMGKQQASITRLGLLDGEKIRMRFIVHD